MRTASYTARGNGAIMRRYQFTGWVYVCALGAVNWFIATRFGYWWLLVSVPITYLVGSIIWMLTFWGE
jgi:hypothetical protein